MIDISLSNKFPYSGDRVFEQIDTSLKLAKIKKEINEHRVARDEPGLQIIDNTFWVGFLKILSRMTYTTLSDNICELKQIKGHFREYSCVYTIRKRNGNSELEINLRIKLPYGPIGFLLSLMVEPFHKLRLKGEFKRLKKLLDEKAEDK